MKCAHGALVETIERRTLLSGTSTAGTHLPTQTVDAIAVPLDHNSTPDPQAVACNTPASPAPTLLTGAVIGTSGSYRNQGNTNAKAFDGNLNTFFDAPAASGDWTGLDLGSVKVISQISYAPRSGWTNRLVGGIFQGSNSANFSSATTLYKITATPPTGSLTTVAIGNTAAFRYVRYIGPTNGYCNIAEAQFFTPTVPFAYVDAQNNLIVTAGSGTQTISITNNENDTLFLVQDNGQSASFDAGEFHNVIVTAGSGNDSITASGGDNGNGITVTGGTGDDNVQITGFGGVLADMSHTSASHVEMRTFASGITVLGGSGNDYISAYGGDAHDVTDGDPQTISISGGGGNDAIYAYAENTTIQDGSGNDVIDVGGSSSLTVTVGSGSDNLIGEGGVLVINGGSGNDVIRTIPIEADQYQYVSALINMGNGNSLVYANDGDVTTINGGTGHDTVYADASDIVNNVSAQNIHLGGSDGLPTGGVTIGTAGSYRNQGNAIGNVFDGDLYSYFDAPAASGGWVGVDFGSPIVISEIYYAPRTAYENRMVGGQFQASNTADFSSGVVTLYTITSTPTARVYSVASLTNTTGYRYYRYIGPANSYCNISELDFFD